MDLIDTLEPSIPSTKIIDDDPRPMSRLPRPLTVDTSLFSETANLGVSTITDFLLDRREISDAAQTAIKRALEDRGVVFVYENGQGELEIIP